MCYITKYECTCNWFKGKKYVFIFVMHLFDQTASRIWEYMPVLQTCFECMKFGKLLFVTLVILMLIYMSHNYIWSMIFPYLCSSYACQWASTLFRFLLPLFSFFIIDSWKCCSINMHADGKKAINCIHVHDAYMQFLMKLKYHYTLAPIIVPELYMNVHMVVSSPIYTQKPHRNISVWF